jgi:hypothetical protein
LQQQYARELLAALCGGFQAALFLRSARQSGSTGSGRCADYLP